MSDFIVTNHGSIVLFAPQNGEASAWIDEHVSGDRQQWAGAIAVELRYIERLMQGAIDDSDIMDRLIKMA